MIYCSSARIKAKKKAVSSDGETELTACEGRLGEAPLTVERREASSHDGKIAMIFRGLLPRLCPTAEERAAADDSESEDHCQERGQPQRRRVQTC